MMKNYTKSQMDAIQDFLTVCIKNNYHCEHCARNHEGICFFAVQCFMNDMSYFDDDDSIIDSKEYQSGRIAAQLGESFDYNKSLAWRAGYREETINPSSGE